MPLYALTIFTSALLLFLLQLVTAKQILPWYGGSAAVWITCLVFFQGVLLLGYAYSDWSTRRLSPKQQAIVHATLLAASLALLPITPDASWQPGGAENPAGRILGLLAATVGLPYFLLSTTNPLLQAWFARAFPAGNPYRLFALSNLASLLAVLGYPAAIEPWLSTGAQGRVWSFAYAAFVALCCAVAWHGLRAASPAGPSAADAVPLNAAAAPATRRTRLLWIALAAMASFLLLAVSNHLTQNIAAAPLLWVLPLSLYLLSFILCFDARRWYRRDLFLSLLAAALCLLVWRPGGGALASGPLFEIGLAALAGLALFQVQERGLAIRGIAAGVVLLTIVSALYRISAYTDGALLITRNFYGVLRVREHKDPATPERDRRELLHGTITHGDQLLDPRSRRALGTYYQTTSGIGRTLRALSRPNARIGIIGLGVGTLAAYGRPGDVYRFYEINPAALHIAKREFTYLAQSAARVETVLGDARLQLEREPGQRFDVLAVDAFAGDAVPLHLLSSEALAVYLRHLSPGGVIAFHVSNQFLDLAKVVQRLADAHGLAAAGIFDKQEDRGGFNSDWVLLTSDRAFFDRPEIRAAATPIPSQPDWRPWTDDYSNLLQVLK